jgi:hypothetical protein
VGGRFEPVEQAGDGQQQRALADRTDEVGVLGLLDQKIDICPIAAAHQQLERARISSRHVERLDVVKPFRRDEP